MKDKFRNNVKKIIDKNQVKILGCNYTTRLIRGCPSRGSENDAQPHHKYAGESIGLSDKI